MFSRGEVDYLSGSEIAFWTDLIEKYLYPLDADKAKQDAIAAGLKELRNKMVFFFSVFNALFVLIVFMLTLHKDTLHIDWPFGVKENITYTEDEQVWFALGIKKSRSKIMQPSIILIDEMP